MNFMQESLHIFSKDVRHLRLVILGWLATLVTVVIAYPRTWQAGYITTRLELLYGLPVLFAWALITLSVLQEPLVTDKSYWITRPYRPAALLVSKSFFVVVVVLAPILLMQAGLIVRAGLPLLPNIPLLLLNGLAISIFLLASFAAAAVAPKFVAVLFYVVGFVTFVGCCVGLYSLVNKGFDPSIAQWVPLALIPIVCACVITIQYLSRRTAFARSIIVAFTLLVAVGTITPMPRIGVPLAYPALQTSDRTLRLHFDTDKDRKIFTGVPKEENGMARLSIPMQIEGLSPDSNQFAVSGVRVHYQAANGAAYDTGWEQRSSESLVPGATYYYMHGDVPMSFIAKAADSPVTFRADFAIAQTHIGTERRYRLSELPTEIEGLGACEIQHSNINFWRGDNLQCRRAVADIRDADMAADWVHGECGLASEPPTMGQAHVYGDQTDGLPLTFTGVNTQLIYPSSGINAQQGEYHLCPGSNVRVRILTAGKKFSTSVGGTIHLRDYLGDVKQEGADASPGVGNETLN